jgi:hypothetical protein
MCKHAFNGDMCILCGEIPLPKGFIPYTVLEIKERPHRAERRPCSNCGRTRKIVAHENCMACYQSGTKFGKYGTSGYEKGLEIAKARFDDPDYKGTRGSYIRQHNTIRAAA